MTVGLASPISLAKAQAFGAAYWDCVLSPWGDISAGNQYGNGRAAGISNEPLPNFTGVAIAPTSLVDKVMLVPKLVDGTVQGALTPYTAPAILTPTAPHLMEGIPLYLQQLGSTRFTTTYRTIAGATANFGTAIAPTPPPDNYTPYLAPTLTVRFYLRGKPPATITRAPFNIDQQVLTFQGAAEELKQIVPVMGRSSITFHITHSSANNVTVRMTSLFSAPGNQVLFEQALVAGTAIATGTALNSTVAIPAGTAFVLLYAQEAVFNAADFIQYDIEARD